MKRNLRSFFLMYILTLVSFPVFAREITVSVGAGKNWKQKSEPQVAIWVENESGVFLKTLYVTQRAGKRKWRMGPKNGRPESLPVWYHKSSDKEIILMQKNNSLGEEIDAVTSATPKGGVIINAEIPDEKCVIKAEFNTSFDYNDYFTKKTSGVNGQPSVIYGAKIENVEKEIVLNLLGTGSLDGSDGNIYKNTEKLTSAKSIVKNIIVKF